MLALVTARGGSKGLPRKNLQDLGGKPLIAWSIEAARASRYADRVVVSTEDAEIAAEARRHGAEVPFTRPAELATDEAPGMAPVLHALTVLPGFDWIVLLQPTSPLRTPADIDACLELCVRAEANACVSVVAATQSPYLMFRLSPDGAMDPLLGWERAADRRQDLPPAYALNGAVYVARSAWLVSSGSFVAPETLAYVMPPERSMDIDTADDLRRCANLLAKAPK